MTRGIETNVLIVGKGGREHALARQVEQSPLVNDVFVAPGNAGTAGYNATGENIPIGELEIDRLVSFVKDPRNHIVLVIPGPEGPISAGLTNALYEAKFRPVFAPTKEAGILEESKIEAIKIMDEAGIPHPSSEFYSDAQKALADIKKPNWNKTVIKADGECGGKGVFLVDTRQEAEKVITDLMIKKTLGKAGQTIVMQEREYGEEVSVFAICDGKIAVPLKIIPHDYKRAFENNEGPNTGGMGAFVATPDPVVSYSQLKWIQQNILQPIVDIMWEKGHPYKGFLYAGLIKTDQGFKVLEFNKRGGDPETQVLMPFFRSDFARVAFDASNGRLRTRQIQMRSGFAVNFVLVSNGYPGKYETGKEIHGLDEVAVDQKEVLIFHAGTKKDGNKTITDGGRVLNVVGLDKKSLASARTKAEGLIGENGIHFENMRYRKDIGLLSS